MSRAPIAIQLLGRLGRLVVAGWAHRCGISLAAAAAVAAGVGASLLAVSVGAALWLRATRAYEDEALGAGALAVAIVLMLFLGGMLVSVVVQGAGSTLTPAARSLTALPIRTRLLALGLGLPGVGLTVAVFLVAAPPAIVVLDGATGYGPGHALVTAATSFVLGALVGRAAFTALRRLLARSGRLAALTLSAAVGGWLAVCALSAWAADGVLESGLDSASLMERGALLWPVVAAYALTPSLGTLVPVAACLLLALALDWRLLGASPAIGVAAPPELPVRCRLSAARGAPLFRLEVARLLRHRRTTAWGLSAVLVFIALVGALWHVDASARASMVANCVLVACQLLAYLPLLARGMSKRERPYQLQLGLDPARWALRLMLASGSVALALLVPFLAAVAAVSGDLTVLVSGPALLAFVVVAASLAGAILTPGTDGGGAELSGALAVFLATVASGVALSRALDTTDLAPIAAGMALIAVMLSWLPGAVESARWQAARGRPAQAALHGLLGFEHQLPRPGGPR